VPGRHRLTITVTDSLYDELCELAGPRRISQWMEDAAWRKIRTLRDGDDPAAPGTPAEAVPSHGIPPPPWCWSPLRPPEPRSGVQAGADLVDL